MDLTFRPARPGETPGTVEPDDARPQPIWLADPEPVPPPPGRDGQIMHKELYAALEDEMSELHELDQLMARALRLLGDVRVDGIDPITRPDLWDAERTAVANAYRDLVLARNDPPQPLVPVDVEPPKYAVIVNRLQQRILNGAYPPGAAIPSESQLMDEFGTSRPTVVRALGILHQAGLIEGQRGKGRYVTDTPAHPAPPPPNRVDVRGIIGEVMLADEAVRRLYHTDPAMRHGVEIVIGTLGTVGDVLVREGESVLYAGHLIELTAQELQKAHNDHVHMEALGTANVQMFGTHPAAPTPGDLS